MIQEVVVYYFKKNLNFCLVEQIEATMIISQDNRVYGQRFKCTNMKERQHLTLSSW
jgi:hypothetical protein